MRQKEGGAHPYTDYAQAIFSISETYRELIKQDSPSEITDLAIKYRSFESKRANAAALMCHQRHCRQQNGDTSAGRKLCPVV